MSARNLLISLFLLFLLSLNVFAQSYSGENTGYYTYSTTGVPDVPYYPALFLGEEVSLYHTESIEINFTTPSLYTQYNTGFASGWNDGALWAGRGLNTLAQTGFSLTWGPLSIFSVPVFTFSQNADFSIMNSAIDGIPYAYISSRIDWPQRFGPDPIWNFSFGQSGIRLTHWNMTFGFSTENMVWGPAYEYPLLMGLNASGFPHIDIGLLSLSTIAGDIEFRLWWGLLDESEYFDVNDDNNSRIFSAMTFGYSPVTVPGLSLGANRVFYSAYQGSSSIQDAFKIFEAFYKVNFSSEDNPSGDDYSDQMVSLWARWRFPSVGFEAFIEWARNDHSWDFRDLVGFLGHSSAYTAGLRQEVETDFGNWLLLGEITSVERTRNVLIRGEPKWYTHHRAVQGYTHQGQLLASPVGPGGSSQFLSIGYTRETFSFGLNARRIAHDNDYYYSRAGNEDWGIFNKFTELIFGLDITVQAYNTRFSASLAESTQYNYNYQPWKDRRNLSVSFWVNHLF